MRWSLVLIVCLLVVAVPACQDGDTEGLEGPIRRGPVAASTPGCLQPNQDLLRSIAAGATHRDDGLRLANSHISREPDAHGLHLVSAELRAQSLITREAGLWAVSGKTKPKRIYAVNGWANQMTNLPDAVAVGLYPPELAVQDAEPTC